MIARPDPLLGSDILFGLSIGSEGEVLALSSIIIVLPPPSPQ